MQKRSGFERRPCVLLSFFIDLHSSIKTASVRLKSLRMGFPLWRLLLYETVSREFRLSLIYDLSGAACLTVKVTESVKADLFADLTIFSV